MFGQKVEPPNLENRELWCPDLELWVERYQHQLYSVAFGILQDPYLALDCVQETFISAGLNYQQLKNKESLVPWLTKILINKCRLARRSQWFRRVTLTDEFDRYTTNDPHSLQMSDIYRAILKLPHKYRVVLLLAYYEQLSTAEIASCLRRKESTCRVWLHRGREMLRKQIEEELK
jgi:RNA polymerase sigma factor (sigma-70 family)